MAGAENQSGPGADGRGTHDIRRRLDALEGKLATAQSRRPQTSDDQERRGKAMGQALRLATELVAGVAVGGLIGWALDQLLDTAPFLMVVFLVLGGAAGIMNVVRTAKAMQGEPMPGHHLRNATKDEED